LPAPAAHGAAAVVEAGAAAALPPKKMSPAKSHFSFKENKSV
jgi:hypothetical protein